MTGVIKRKIFSSFISTHTLTWSVTICGRNPGAYAFYFNSHAHVERDVLWTLDKWYGWNFNSHAHVERDSFPHFFHHHWHISTHTLTWSVTLPSSISRKLIFISTHTLTWSVTLWATITVFINPFQLTRSRGAWLYTYIHIYMHIHFNSHAHVERDKLVSDTLSYVIHFNSHAHVERDTDGSTV